MGYLSPGPGRTLATWVGGRRAGRKGSFLASVGWDFVTRMACAAAILTPLLAGCVFDGEQASVALPDTPDAFRAERSRAAPTVGDWPRLFGSSELASLMERSRTDNFDVASAHARILQAMGLAKSTGSALYPQLSGTENASRTQTAGTERSEKPPFINGNSTNYSLGFSASYVLDLFGRNRALADAADINALASRYDRDVVVVATLASVANTWFELVASQDRLRLAQDNIRVAQRVLDAIRARLQVGTATALDTAQQEGVVATQRASVPALEQTVQQNRNLLAVLVGQTPESMSVRGGSLNALKIPTPRAGLPSQLLLRRPDVASAETKLVAQRANVKAARAAFFPTINLSASLVTNSLVLANLFGPSSISASLAQGLVQPIFDGANLQGQLEQASGRRIELLEDYRKSIVTAFSDVENALIATQQTARHEQLQRIVVDAARRAYQITEQRLREGTIDEVTLLATQTTLFQARDQLIQVRLQRFQAAVQLYQALGGGFTIEDSPGLVIIVDPSAPERLTGDAK